MNPDKLIFIGFLVGGGVGIGWLPYDIAYLVGMSCAGLGVLLVLIGFMWAMINPSWRKLYSQKQNKEG